MAEIHPNSWIQAIKEAYIPYSNEYKGTKNYGLGIRMINWPNGKNFYYHNGWWHGNMASYVTRRKKYIALSNKYDKRVYKVKLSALFGIILFN
jgi:hypothetical protein